MLAAGYADSAHAQDLSQEWMFPGSIPRNSPLGSSEHVYLEGTSAANKASAEGASGARSGAGAFDANGEQKKEKKPQAQWETTLRWQFFQVIIDQSHIILDKILARLQIPQLIL